jgi:hypothetical protein
MKVFNTSASYFCKNLFHFLKDYSKDQTDPRVKYALQVSNNRVTYSGTVCINC